MLTHMYADRLTPLGPEQAYYEIGASHRWLDKPVIRLADVASAMRYTLLGDGYGIKISDLASEGLFVMIKLGLGWTLYLTPLSVTQYSSGYLSTASHSEDDNLEFVGLTPSSLTLPIGNQSEGGHSTVEIERIVGRSISGIRRLGLVSRKSLKVEQVAIARIVDYTPDSMVRLGQVFAS